MKTEDKIKVMQAFVDGETILREYKATIGFERYWEVDGDPVWDWYTFNYKVKTE